MTRQAFMERLRKGLAGLAPTSRAEILADYETHFADGEAAGRSEAEVIAALGDPDRLARELRAEAGLKRWEAGPTPSGAASAVSGLLGLGALDILIILPVLVSLGSALFGFAVAALMVFLAGAVAFVAGPFSGIPGGPLAAVLLGVGLMTGGAAIGAILVIAIVGLINALVWYARLHFRLLRPALDTQAFGGAI
jgi:uncharacterized membrane protein